MEFLLLMIPKIKFSLKHKFIELQKRWLVNKDLSVETIKTEIEKDK